MKTRIPTGSATVTLPTDTEILITRTFGAPPDLVFEVWTTPRHVERWWGSADAPVVLCEIDLRVGGAWRYVVRDQSGAELGWRGTYLEVEAPRRLVATELFEAHPEGEAVNTATFEVGPDGTTVLTVLVRHSSRENRDGHVNSGMEPGMQRTFDRLDELATGLVEARP